MKGLVLLTFSVPALAGGYEPPKLPIHVALSGEGAVCGSAELRQNVQARFFRIVDEEPIDLRLNCEEDAANVVLTARIGKKGGRFRVERTPSSTVADLAYLSVQAVATDKEIVACALDSYVAFNGRVGALGADEFASKDWGNTARHLYAGLESDLNAAPLYFGLYRAHAEMTHPMRAKWYLMAFLRAGKRDPSVLTKEQAMPLIRVEASGADDRGAEADALFKEYQGYAAQHRWDAALRRLRDVIEAAPWYEPAYVSLAQSYDEIGWTRLAKVWKARAVFVRKLNKDSQLGKDVEARLDELAAR